MMRSFLFSFITVAGLATAVPIRAQTLQAVPARAAAQDGESLRWLPGAGPALRAQLLIEGSQLQGRVGQTLTGLAMRRDRSVERAMLGGEIDWSISVSTAPFASVDAARSAFDANHGPDLQNVFSGRVTVPFSAAGPAPPSWGPGDAVRVPFVASGFVYRGGVLCVDLVAIPRSGPPADWSVDAVSDLPAGSTRSIGSSCQDPNLVAPIDGGASNHLIAANELVIGGTVECRAFAAPGALAILLVGLAEQLPGLDLGWLNAPGCRLHVQPIIAGVPHLVGDPPLATVPWTGGVVSDRLQLPNDLNLLGGDFVTQWIELRGPVIRTTNAVAATIALASPGLGMAWVESEVGAAMPAAVGSVSFREVPVVQFEWQ
jgi:hypothetical protein